MVIMREVPSKDAWLEEIMGTPASNREQLAVVRRALHDVLTNELSERQREMITMRYFEGMASSEIARTLEVCPSTVTRTLQRARKRIYASMRFYFDYRSIRITGDHDE